VLRLNIWKRLAIAIAAMIVASLIAGILWRSGFNTRIPSYLSGVIGGLAALGAWEFLRSKKA
jgi:hypothetical protein